MRILKSSGRAFMTLLLACAMLAAPGEAASRKKLTPADRPMRVVVVRNNIPGCEPLCPQWISAEGRITAKTPAAFRTALAKAHEKRLPVIISSLGGDVDAAIAIGELIRANRLDVVVGWTYFADCQPYRTDCALPEAHKGIFRGIAMSGRGFCFSACSFVLAGGERRLWSTGASLGVHQISRTITRQRIRYLERYVIMNGRKKVLSRKMVSRKPMASLVSTELDKRLRRKVAAYFARMGIDAALFALFDTAPPASMHMLSPAEALSTKLVTARISAVSLVEGSLCKTDPPADNCVFFEDQRATVAP